MRTATCTVVPSAAKRRTKHLDHTVLSFLRREDDPKNGERRKPLLGLPLLSQLQGRVGRREKRGPEFRGYRRTARRTRGVPRVSHEKRTLRIMRSGQRRLHPLGPLGAGVRASWAVQRAGGPAVVHIHRNPISGADAGVKPQCHVVLSTADAALIDLRAVVYPAAHGRQVTARRVAISAADSGAEADIGARRIRRAAGGICNAAAAGIEQDQLSGTARPQWSTPQYLMLNGSLRPAEPSTARPVQQRCPQGQVRKTIPPEAAVGSDSTAPSACIAR
jgi:hypothetical protein